VILRYHSAFETYMQVSWILFNSKRLVTDNSEPASEPPLPCVLDERRKGDFLSSQEFSAPKLPLPFLPFAGFVFVPHHL
jgi:hypothetical protein